MKSKLKMFINTSGMIEPNSTTSTIQKIDVLRQNRQKSDRKIQGRSRWRANSRIRRIAIKIYSYMKVNDKGEKTA